MGVLYILDEPSIGLHQRDNARLIRTLERLRDIGNTLIVVEHDEETMRAADWIVDIGPGAGQHGGQVVAEGTMDDIAARAGIDHRAVPVRPRATIPMPHDAAPGQRQGADPEGRAREQPAQRDRATSRSARSSCVTGVSGSGKSSLVTDTLYPRLAMELHNARQTSRAPTTIWRGSVTSTR